MGKGRSHLCRSQTLVPRAPAYLPLTGSPFPLQAETRAEFAERSVAKLEKTIDDLEGRFELGVGWGESNIQPFLRGGASCTAELCLERRCSLPT